MELWERNPKEKKKSGGGLCPRAMGRAPHCHTMGSAFEKHSIHIFRNLKREVVIDYNTIYYYLQY